MRKKQNESVPIALFVVLLLLLTAGAGGIAWAAKNDGMDFSFLQKKETKQDVKQQSDAASAPQEPQVEEDPMEQLPVPEKELRKIADTYGENFGILVSEGESSVAEDIYCADLLYQVDYSNGQVQLNSRTKELYWVYRDDVKTEETRLTERELIKKAKEYLAMLQIEQEYGHIVRRIDAAANRATVIFQKVIREEDKLYSDYEAVKMTLSMQNGELITCKVFSLPLAEQEGQQLTDTQAIAAVLEEEPAAFAARKAKPELIVSSPFVWGEQENYTSRIVWKLQGDRMVYYVDAYNGNILGKLSIEQDNTKP